MKPFSFLCVVAVAFVSTGMYAAPQQPATTNENRAKNVPPDLVDQKDPTDIYAVPVDTSEQEEELIQNKLEKIQKDKQDAQKKQ